MSYEHQLHLTMRFPSETDARAVHRAFQSLLQYFGHPWASEEAFGNEPLLMDQCEVAWSRSPAGGFLSVQTSGPVSYDFVDRVRDCMGAASRLTPDRGCADLWDLETGNLPHMLTRIPFGSTARERALALVEAALDRAWQDLVGSIPISPAVSTSADAEIRDVLFRSNLLPALTDKLVKLQETTRGVPDGPKPSL